MDKVKFVDSPILVGFPVGGRSGADKNNLKPMVFLGNGDLFGAERGAEKNGIQLDGVWMPSILGELPQYWSGPWATGKVDAKKLRAAQMVTLAHELAHALFETTDYFDPAAIPKEWLEEIRKKNGGKIPAYGNANPRGINIAIENLVRAQLGFPNRSEYIHARLEYQKDMNKDEISRFNRFLESFGFPHVKAMPGGKLEWEK